MPNYSNFIQTGAYSILLGPQHYKSFIEHRHNKLLKISKITHEHNDLNYSSVIRSIKDSYKYYSIPEEEYVLLKKTDKFYDKLKELINAPSFFDYRNFLHCHYIDFAGNKELIETIIEIDNNDFTYWSSYSKIIKFTYHILKGLKYLHEKTICHLDIKAENIVINTFKNTYKIIDFGFSAMEPFEKYVKNIQGTPGYFPKNFDIEEDNPWLPKINANDTFLVNGEIPFVTNRKLVYKIDSFCLGRTIYYLKYIYKDNKKYACFNYESNKETKINNILDSLLENDVNKRLTVTQCLQKYY